MKGILIILFTVVWQYSQAITDSVKVEFKRERMVSIYGGIPINQYKRIEEYHIEGTYFLPILKKSYLGLNLGYYNQSKWTPYKTGTPYYNYWNPNYETKIARAWRKNDIFIGIALQHNFYYKPTTPYLGISYLVDYNNCYNNQSCPYFNHKWDFGSTFLIKLGYKIEIPDSHWALDISYNASIRYAKTFFHTYSKSNYEVYNANYEFFYVYYFLMGINYNF